MSPSAAIEALREVGHTDKSIADLVGVDQSTICRIRNRQATPNYPLGRALVDLAEQRRPNREAA